MPCGIAYSLFQRVRVTDQLAVGLAEEHPVDRGQVGVVLIDRDGVRRAAAVEASEFGTEHILPHRHDRVAVQGVGDVDLPAAAVVSDDLGAAVITQDVPEIPARKGGRPRARYACATVPKSTVLLPKYSKSTRFLYYLSLFM